MVTKANPDLIKLLPILPKTFVVTGHFPEVGEANVKAMIETFGGKAITRFSKKTSKYTFLYCARLVLDVSNIHI